MHVNMLPEMKARRKKIESPAIVGVSDAFGYATEGMHVSAEYGTGGKEAVQCL